MSNPTLLFFPQYDSKQHHLELSKSNALLQYGSFFGLLHFYCMLILRALNGVVLNRIEGRTTMLDWTLDVYIYRFSFSCPWVTIFLHSRELNLKI
jgi:hypothetical protein